MQYVFKPLEKTGDGKKKRGKIKVKHRQNKANTKKTHAITMKY